MKVWVYEPCTSKESHPLEKEFICTFRKLKSESLLIVSANTDAYLCYKASNGWSYVVGDDEVMEMMGHRQDGKQNWDIPKWGE